MGLGPDSYEEAKESREKQDQWRRESARRYDQKQREEHDSKYRDIGHNPERREERFQQAYGGDERAAWVRRQPCLVCSATPSQNAHTEAGGMGMKADADTVIPLCHDHHRQLHNIGAETFEDRHGFSLDKAAKETETRWQEYKDE